MGVSPFPQILFQPQSGLPFPWVEFHPDRGIMGSGDFAFGPDGVNIGMVMLINWGDLATALQSLLGYSWRDTSTVPSTLRRKLPWQNAYSPQLWVKNITSVKGVLLRGTQSVIIPLAGVGAGNITNLGPGTIFQYALLTIHFWRPPYFVRTDQDIQNTQGVQQEWLRYVDKNWDLNTQVLSREGTTYVFTSGPAAGQPFSGSVGQNIAHLRVKRKWYEIPEAALFQTAQDSTPQGLPVNFLYTQTQTTNPISTFVYPVGSPITNTVNSPIGGGTNDAQAVNRFFGAFMGTLLYVGQEFIPRPLQLPPALMQIAGFTGAEPISQVQYDVVLHWDIFDPPRDNTNQFRGHNLAPYPGNNLWYPVRAQQDISGAIAGPFDTPFRYADHTDLFKIL
jgi:hypothetical protein